MPETVAQSENQPKSVSKPKRERSPSFPFIALPTAIKRLTEFEEYSKRHPVPAKHSGRAWGMKGWTSQAQQTLAALKSFGLVEYRGSGDSLEALVSEDARTFLRAQQESVKRDVLKRVALKPKNLAKYFAQWGAERPPNEVCLDHLVLRGGFTDGAAKLFLNVYDSTITYAGLAASDKIDVAVDEEEDDQDDDQTSDIDVGDLVQRETDGVPRFDRPRRVRKVVEDQGQKWIYVDGSEAAFPMDEAILEQKSGQIDSGKRIPPPLLPLDEAPANWHEERLLDDEGEEIFIRYKGEPSADRYEFIRDYLDFKLKRLQKGARKDEAAQ